MPVSVGLSADGLPTPALLKKLAGLGAGPEAVPNLKRRLDGKAEALYFENRVTGVSLATGLQQALEEARPLRESAIQLSTQATALEDTFKERKKSGKATKKVLEKLEQDWKAKLKESRDASANAEAIENTVYDLKAVNPDRINTDDQRTPSQLLTVIAEKGKEADAALERLQGLIANASD